LLALLERRLHRVRRGDEDCSTPAAPQTPVRPRPTTSHESRTLRLPVIARIGPAQSHRARAA
jgi:hypothetical protein